MPTFFSTTESFTAGGRNKCIGTTYPIFTEKSPRRPFWNRFHKMPFLEQVSQVACGAHYAGAIKEDGSVWTWGRNDFGRLGRPGISLNENHGPGRVESFDDSVFLTKVACTDHSMVVLDDQGKLYSWGSHEYGQTGQGLNEGFSVHPAQLQEELPPMTHICASHNHAVALSHDGKVYTWGGFGGRFGCPTYLTTSFPTILSQIHFGAVTTDGKVFTWGDNYYDQLDKERTPCNQQGQSGFDFGIATGGALDEQRIGKLAFGERHSVAISADSNSLFVWGANSSNGATGLGCSEGLYTPERTSLPKAIPQPISGKLTECIAIGGYTALLVDPRFEKRMAAKSLLHLPALFNNPDSFPDVEFTLDGKTVCVAHKSILSAKASYFDGLFHTEMQEASRNQLPIVHCSKHVFLKVIEFIYEVDMDRVEADKMPELYQAADIYLLEDLKSWCREVLTEGLSLQNVGVIMQDLFSRGHDELVNVCLTFLHLNQAQWMKDKDLKRQVTSKELWIKIYEFSIESPNGSD